MEQQSLNLTSILPDDVDTLAQPYKMHYEHVAPLCDLNPRQYRLLQILFEHRECSRRDLDSLIGAINSPQTVSEMREKYGLDILMVKKKMLDRDRKATWRGIYSLSEDDRKRAQSIFSTVYQSSG